MATESEPTGKSKGRAGRRDAADIDERNELETIPTMVPGKGTAIDSRAPDQSDRGWGVSANVVDAPYQPVKGGR